MTDLPCNREGCTPEQDKLLKFLWCYRCSPGMFVPWHGTPGTFPG